MKGFSVILPIIWSELFWKQSIWNTSAFGDQNSNQSPALGLICSHQVYMLQFTLSGGGTVERKVLCFHGLENGNRRLVIGPTSPWQLQSKFQKLLAICNSDGQNFLFCGFLEATKPLLLIGREWIHCPLKWGLLLTGFYCLKLTDCTWMSERFSQKVNSVPQLHLGSTGRGT